MSYQDARRRLKPKLSDDIASSHQSEFTRSKRSGGAR